MSRDFHCGLPVSRVYTHLPPVRPFEHCFYCLLSRLGACSSLSLVRLLVIVAAVQYCECAVLAGGEPDPLALAVPGGVGDERAGRVVILAGRHREVQLPQIEEAGKDHNAPGAFIANTDGNCQGKWIRLTARPDGTFTVLNSRNNYEKTYQR